MKITRILFATFLLSLQQAHSQNSTPVTLPPNVAVSPASGRLTAADCFGFEDSNYLTPQKSVSELIQNKTGLDAINQFLNTHPPITPKGNEEINQEITQRIVALKSKSPTENEEAKFEDYVHQLYVKGSYTEVSLAGKLYFESSSSLQPPTSFKLELEASNALEEEKDKATKRLECDISNNYGLQAVSELKELYLFDNEKSRVNRLTVAEKKRLADFISHFSGNASAISEETEIDNPHFLSIEDCLQQVKSTRRTNRLDKFSIDVLQNTQNQEDYDRFQETALGQIESLKRGDFPTAKLYLDNILQFKIFDTDFWHNLFDRSLELGKAIEKCRHIQDTNKELQDREGHISLSPDSLSQIIADASTEENDAPDLDSDPRASQDKAAMDAEIKAKQAEFREQSHDASLSSNQEDDLLKVEIDKIIKKYSDNAAKKKLERTTAYQQQMDAIFQVRQQDLVKQYSMVAGLEGLEVLPPPVSLKENVLLTNDVIQNEKVQATVAANSSEIESIKQSADQEYFEYATSLFDNQEYLSFVEYIEVYKTLNGVDTLPQDISRMYGQANGFQSTVKNLSDAITLNINQQNYSRACGQLIEIYLLNSLLASNLSISQDDKDKMRTYYEKYLKLLNALSSKDYQNAKDVCLQLSNDNPDFDAATMLPSIYSNMIESNRALEQASDDFQASNPNQFSADIIQATSLWPNNPKIKVMMDTYLKTK